MKYDFSPKGVCARRLEFELDGDIVKNVRFKGGCNGNLKALAALTDAGDIESFQGSWLESAADRLENK